MKSLVLFFTAVFFFSGASYASKDMSYKEYILNEFKKQKELFSKTDSESRKIKSLIYETAKKLEKLNDEDRDLREKILITKAKISERLSGLKVKQEVIEAEKKKLHLTLDANQIRLSQIVNLKKLFHRFPGAYPVCIGFHADDRKIATLEIESKWGVGWNPRLEDQLKKRIYRIMTLKTVNIENNKGIL